jgi:hypothetical protein
VVGASVEEERHRAWTVAGIPATHSATLRPRYDILEEYRNGAVVSILPTTRENI